MYNRIHCLKANIVIIMFPELAVVLSVVSEPSRLRWGIFILPYGSP